MSLRIYQKALPDDPPAIKRALELREFHRNEATRLDDFVVQYRALSNEPTSQPMAPQVGPYNGIKILQVPAGIETARKHSQGSAAIEILRQRGPMPARDLVPIVRSMGVMVGGKDPATNLSSVLSHRQDAEYNLETKCWQLRNVAQQKSNLTGESRP